MPGFTPTSFDDNLQSFPASANLQIDYARALNEQQYAAVTAPPGPALVIAGAGSGKTRTLTYRVAYLLEQGIPPNRILLLTFTNKAAKEMMRRVHDVLGRDLAALWGGTFHAMGMRILRRHADRLGYPLNFTVVDREDAQVLVKACLEEAQIKPKASGFPKAEVLLEMFSFAVNTQAELPEIVHQHYRKLESHLPRLLPLQNRYAARKRELHLMDFDDLLVLWRKLFQEHAEVLAHYQKRFQFILVDEYQDTNKVQSDLIDMLAARHHNVMAVGDDAQSIYSWRGANFRNILDFPKRYPQTAVYKVETNYRSTPEILNLANAVISQNDQQFTKILVSARRTGNKPVLAICEHARQQAAFVVEQVQHCHAAGVPLREIVVLYRSHVHALELQWELKRHKIPFTITSGIRFYEQAHVKDMAAFLRLAANPEDEPAFKRLVKMLPGLGDKAAQKLWNAFQAKDGEHSMPPAKARSGGLQELSRLVPAKTARDWAQFAETMEQISAGAMVEKPAKMIRFVLDGVYEDYLEATYDNARFRREDLAELAEFSTEFSSVQDFLSELALLSNVDSEDNPSSAEEDQIRLSTVHQAKGLEFQVVFVITLGEGRFPSFQSLGRPEAVEEECRLFYVAVTRAKDQLYLSFPRLRHSAEGGVEYVEPSRFVQELPKTVVEQWPLASDSGWI